MSQLNSILNEPFSIDVLHQSLYLYASLSISWTTFKILSPINSPGSAHRWVFFLSCSVIDHYSHPSSILIMISTNNYHCHRGPCLRMKSTADSTGTLRRGNIRTDSPKNVAMIYLFIKFIFFVVFSTVVSIAADFLYKYIY